MHKLTVYPIGNGNTVLTELEGGRVLIMDYANLRDPADKTDRRWDIKTDISSKLQAMKRTDVDVFCISHTDDDHLCGASDFFYLEHAAAYQASDRIKIQELWVPAGAITEEGCEDAARIWRQEARHRLKAGKGIRVFGRPQRLKDWLNSNGLTLEARAHLITDAGKTVDGFTKEADGVEFFLHSPHAHRINDREVEDRNQDCVVMQAVFVSGGSATRVILAGDAPWEAMDDIVGITKYHKNEARLDWDVFLIPHHCSYLSLSDMKGTTKTEPKPAIREWFEKAPNRAIIVSSSWEIGTADQTQPPHFQTAAFYKEIRDRVKGQFKVTMEHPSTNTPKPLVLRIDGFGPTVETISAAAAYTATTHVPPRAG